MLWLIAIAAIVSAGFKVDGYKLHVARIPLPHSYPIVGVIVTSLELTFVLGTIFALIRPASYARSWGRASCATVFAAVAFLASSGVHPPPYYLAYSLVLVCLTLGLAALFLVSVVAEVRHRSARFRS